MAKKDQTLLAEKPDQTNQLVEEIQLENTCQESEVELQARLDGEQTNNESQSDGNNQCNQEILDSFKKDVVELAGFLGVSVKELREEIYFTQIKKIMSKIHKVIVRYDMTETELEKIFFSAGRYGLGGMTVAPVYLSNCVKQNKKSKYQGLPFCSIIDFPFGESSFMGKVSNVKESLKAGASSVAVTMPTMMLNKENLKTFKKECKKLCRLTRNRAGIVLNASDINEENYVEGMKTIRKTKIAFITLAFGDATMEEVKHKLAVINRCGITKSLFVIANVERLEQAIELTKLNVARVLTPYADAIGEDLIKRYNLV